MPLTVGSLRQQSALTGATTPVMLVSDDPSLHALLRELDLVVCFPDTTDQDRRFIEDGTFKIKVRRG